MWLRKEIGGCSILYEGTEYAWPDDGSVCEVPEKLGLELLAIRGGGYSGAGPADSQAAPKKRTTAKAAKTGSDEDEGEDATAGT